MKVLVSDPLASDGIEELKKEKDIEVDVQTDLTPGELLKIIGDYEGLIVRSQTKVTKDVIDSAKKLKVIARAGTGIDNVNVEAATRKGIIVMNVPGGNTISAAENTIAMILSMSRNIPQANASMKNGKWEKKKFTGTEVHDKILGIIGLGRIGTEVAKMAQGLGMHTIGYDPFVFLEQAKKMGIEYVKLQEIFKKSDYITVHTPFSKETRHLIGKREFALMKDGVRIINCARGGIIDETALYDAIKTGKVAGAALDVFESEPPERSPLLTLDSVITTPHLGASTQEAQVRVAVDAAKQVVDVLKRGMVRNALNVASIEPELLKQIKPYLDMAEILGSLHGQLACGPVNSVQILYSGDVANYNLNPMTISIMKAMLEPMLGNSLNFVNVLTLAKERGIKIIEGKSNTPQDFTNFISVEVDSSIGKKLIAGTVFSKNLLRIVRIDEFNVDIVPSSHMLICTHEDKPGMVGKIGTILGKEKINIAGLQLSRRKKGETNLTILNVDTTPSDSAIKKIKEIEGIQEVHLIKKGDDSKKGTGYFLNEINKNLSLSLKNLVSRG
ncbi:phosphoglycerate dehydrogenase [Candidatus Desantisbacteria bacterium CG1_02_38_46]|uniref:D-3-phosphoglycerate dehydrogenase n=2 Tax=unclassified Candidatus Desantisiibacteriota TaxID=3106372 RepID=A0A1J4SBA8_9BACT|nr:MAG: phosphoglycerate dehydrogenase [Candidatus Desantisbacteria bacterium CG1_02_38_46]PIU51214.1 MAG: phosphoglycerate dehydrogenase [Candidatus Desantisbacteria bacterium CG07_land_8_20_14_0_80_39_15]